MNAYLDKRPWPLMRHSYATPRRALKSATMCCRPSRSTTLGSQPRMVLALVMSGLRGGGGAVDLGQ